MKRSELRQIAEELVEKLRDMLDGTEISSVQLLCVAGYDSEEFDFSELMDCHQFLFQAARENHITLDMSKHDNKVEGLLYNLDFVVHNKKAQIKCPYCGSKNIGRILYGMPDFSAELQKKLDSGKIHLGGCEIELVPDSNGDAIEINPRRYCNDCHKEFARRPYLISEDYKTAETYSNIVTGIYFFYGGYLLKDFEEIDFKKNTDGAIVSVSQSSFKKEPLCDCDHQITALRWSRLVNRLYRDFYLHEWKREYNDFNVLDGEHWSLEISMTNNRKETYNGSNAYPPYWKELRALLHSYARR